SEPRFLAIETGAPDARGVIGGERRALGRIRPGPGMGRRQIGPLDLEDADALTTVRFRHGHTVAIAESRLQPPTLLYGQRPNVVLVGSPFTGRPLEDFVSRADKIAGDLLFVTVIGEIAPRQTPALRIDVVVVRSCVRRPRFP